MELTQQNNFRTQDMPMFAPVFGSPDDIFRAKQLAGTSVSKMDYGITDWFSDATSAFYQSLQQGEMEESLDRILASQENKADAEAYAEYLQMTSALRQDELERYKNENSEEYKYYSDRLENLRKTGAWSNNFDPSPEDLKKIINDADETIAEAQKNYAIDREQYLRSRRNNDISQYYTMKSNEEIMRLGNFFHKMPATMGTSNTSAGWQAISMGMSAAGAKAGAAIGSVVGPIGTVVGSGLGALAGGLWGNIEARQNESHMEAFGGVKQRALEELAKQGVDTKDVIQAVRNQYEQAGVDVSLMSDDMLLSEAMTNPDIRSGNKAFDEIVSESFKGSRRLYERNMALGAGEVVADMTYFVPLGKYVTTPLKGIGNAITKGLTKRAAAGVAVAKKSLDIAAQNLTKRVHKDFWKNAVTGTLFRSTVEASEEGTQGIWTDEFVKGEYDGEYANDSFIDAIGDGQVFSDLAENVGTRLRSLYAAITPYDSEYSDDEKLFEQMVSGFLLPFTSPQGAIGGFSSFKDYVTRVQNSKKFANAYSDALLSQDALDRAVALNKMIRQEGISSENYMKVLQTLKDELKTGKYDTSALTENGNQTPSEQDIDQYFDKQVAEYKRLSGIRKNYRKFANRFELSDEEQDVYYALVNNKLGEKQGLGDLAKNATLAMMMMNSRIANSPAHVANLRDWHSIPDNLELNDSEKAALAQIAMINKQISIIDALTERGASQAELQSALRDLIGISVNVDTISEQLGQLQELRTKLFEQRDKFVETLSKHEGLNTDSAKIAMKYFDYIDDTLVEDASKLLSGMIGLSIYESHLDDQIASFKSDEDFTKSAITAYNTRVRRQREQADAADAAARAGEDASQQNPQELSTQSLEQEIEQLRNNVTTNVTQFEQQLQNVPESSPLYKMVTSIRRGLQLATTVEEKATFIQKKAEAFSNKYTQESAREGATDEEKALAKQLADQAKSIADYFKKLNDNISEQKARKQVRNPKLKNHNTVYTTPTGERVQFNMQDARYTEEGGLVLQMANLDDVVDQTQVDQKIAGLNKAIYQIQKMHSQSDKVWENLIAITTNERAKADYTAQREKEKADAEAQIAAIRKTIDAVRKSSQPVYTEVAVNQSRDMLDSLTATNNKGETKQFKTHLDKILEELEKEIKDRQEARKNRTDDSYHMGDVVNDRRTDETILRQWVDNFEESVNRQLSVFGYTLNTTQGARYQSKLANPHFRANHWAGYIYMPYSSVEKLEAAFSKNLKGETQSAREKELDQKLEFTVGKKKYSRREAIKTFNALGKALANAKMNDATATKVIDTLISGKSVKIGNATFTAAEWDNMVGALPVASTLWQPRAGYVFIVHPDAGSMNKTEVDSQAELQRRAELIGSLVISFDPKVAETATEEQLSEIKDFNDDDVMHDKHRSRRTNGVRIKKGSVKVFSKGFSFKLDNESDLSDVIFLNEDGDEMSQSELQTWYKTQTTSLMSKLSDDATIKKIVEALLPYYDDVTKEFLLAQNDEGDSHLYRLALGAFKYGDGFISRDTFVKDYLNKENVGVAKTTGHAKQATEIRAKIVLDLFRNIAPDGFRSYRDVQADLKNTPDVAISVKQAIDGLYNTKIKVVQNDIEFSFSPSAAAGTEEYKAQAASIREQEYVDRITSVMRQIEQLLTSSNTADEFWQALTDAGFEFKATGVDAETVLREYFNNRKFQLLSQPTNIVSVLTFGTANPMRETINPEQFRVRSKKRQSKLSDVDSLGLVKGKDGEYVFSIEKWRRKTDDELADERQNEVADQELAKHDVKIKQLEEDGKTFAKQIKDTNYKDVDGLNKLLKAILRNFNQEDLNTEEFFPKNKVTRNGLNNLLRAVQGSAIESAERDRAGYIERKAKEDLKSIEEQSEDFDNLNTAPLDFIVGGPNGTAIYVDRFGDKHTMKNVKVTPGAIYLRIPRIFHPGGTHAFVKLNNRRLDERMAEFVTTLFVAGSHVNFEQKVSSLNLQQQGFSITGDYSIMEVLEELIYIGRDAVINDPTTGNYNRLLYVEDGIVHYGNSIEDSGYILNANDPDSVAHFTQWLLENKTFRIDREKLHTRGYAFSKSLEIHDTTKKEGQTRMYGHQEGQYYTSQIIEDGLLTTTLDPTSGAKIFTEMRVYSDYERPSRYQSAANSKKSKTTTGKEKALKPGEEVVEITWDEAAEAIVKKSSKKLNMSDADKKMYTKQILAQINDAIHQYTSRDAWDELNSSMTIVIHDPTGKQVKGRMTKNDDKITKITAVTFNAIAEQIEAGYTEITLSLDNPLYYSGEDSLLTKEEAKASKFIIKITKPNTAKESESHEPAKTAQQSSKPVTTVAANSADPYTVPEGCQLVINKVVGKNEDGTNKYEQIVVPAGANVDQFIDSLPGLSKVQAKAIKASTKKNLDSGDLQYTRVGGAVPPATTGAAEGVDNKADETPNAAELIAGGASAEPGAAPVHNTTATFDEVVVDSDYIKSAIQWARTKANSKDSDLILKTASEYYKKLNEALESGNQSEYISAAKTIAGLYLAKEYKKSMSDVQSKLAEASPAAFNTVWVSARNASVKFGDAVDFFDTCVEKIDHQEALDRVRKIFGDDFSFELTTDQEQVWDTAREAQIYVYGMCTAAGIRLLHDGQNKVAKGAIEHEAFHRVSLFLLSEKDRQRMYDDARQRYGLQDYSDKYIEEFLADEFKKFAINSASENRSKYYSDNTVVKMFQKLFDGIRYILNKFFKANVVKHYRSINKLFEDMYSGRYAYAKATVKNKQLFNILYEDQVAYSGIKGKSGKVMAKNAKEFSDIEKNLIGRLLTESGMIKQNEGEVAFNFKKLKEFVKSQIDLYRSNAENFEAQGFEYLEQFLQATQICQTWQNIYENFGEWKSHIQGVMRSQFKLHKENQADANAQAKEDLLSNQDDETSQNVETGDVSPYDRESFKKNLYDTTSMSTKSLLWMITESDKLDANGMLQYADTRTLWFSLMYDLQGIRSVDEMLDKVGRISRRPGNPNANKYQQFHQLLVDADPSIQKAVFTDLARLYNTFVNSEYLQEFEDLTDEQAARGAIPAVTVTGAIKNSNYNQASANSTKSWIGNTRDALAMLAGELAKKKTLSEKQKLIVERKAELDAAIRKIGQKGSAKDLAEALKNLYNIEVDAEQLRKFINRQTKNESDLKKFKEQLRSQMLLSVTSALKQENINKILDTMYGLKSVMRNFSDTADGTSDVKNATTRGAQGGKMYVMSAWDYISRFFKQFSRDDSEKTPFAETVDGFLTKMQRNPYCKNSVWLKEFVAAAKRGDFPIKLFTESATVVDNDIFESRSAMQLNAREDIINKFLSILSGYHIIPSLANKEKSYRISGFANSSVHDALIVTSNGWCDVNRTAASSLLNRFVGYLADEFMAIANAMQTRDNFISELNRITGKSFTAESFSKLSSTQQEELKEQYNLGELFKTLVLNYHYKKGKPEIVKNSEGKLIKRAGGIDLVGENITKQPGGYNFRHFRTLMQGVWLTKEQVSQLTGDNANQYALSMAEQYRDKLAKVMLKNVALSVNRFIKEGLISGRQIDVTSPKFGQASFENLSLTNKLLPVNALLENKEINDFSNNKDVITQTMLLKAIGFYTLKGMQDMIEFEKLVSGDIAFFKDITDVNKRYSALTSTIQLNDKTGTIVNVFDSAMHGMDRLYDSPTYNTITFNTSVVSNLRDYEKYVADFLGDPTLFDKNNFVHAGKQFTLKIDPKQLLDSRGNFTDAAKRGILVNLYIQHRNNGHTIAAGLSDAELAKVIVQNFNTRFDGYLNIDPTDAQTWITAEFDRQLRQRIGKWTEYDEACYNLMEHFDEIDKLVEADEMEVVKMCQVLNIRPVTRQTAGETTTTVDAQREALNVLLDQFAKWKSGDRQKMNEYKGWVLSVCKDFDTTSKKYVHYGYAERVDDLFVPIYDKLSASPIYKIFAEGHQMQQIYEHMRARQIDMAKMESAVKVGGAPSVEVFDKDGNFNEEAMRSAVIQQQLFDLFGKQLNTDPHNTNSATLLTQFMKIAVTNIKVGETYNINGTKIKGRDLLRVYQQILDELTVRGHNKFMKRFGVTVEDGAYRVNKETFMKELYRMAETQDLPPETLAALSTDNGEFTIHPAALPNINWIQSRLISQMDKTIIKTVTPGQPLYQVTSLGYDNLHDVKTHADVHLRACNDNNCMEVKLSINFFADVLEAAGLKYANFEDQRKFILANKDLLSLAYRVPTQGQNSTIPVEVVDVFSAQRGAIIMFPADITAKTGSDFDIDKMFLARYNYKVVNGQMEKVQYDAADIAKKLSAGTADSVTDQEMQNFLLDIYLGVLTSPLHKLEALTPLDVTTAPLIKIKDEIEAITGVNDEALLADMYWLNPVFQTDQKIKNAGADNGIGPMALNNVFRFFIQMSNLRLRPNKYLQELGLDNLNRIYDRNGNDILDSTSALINAHVDAAKNNYIGRMNVNSYTYDVTSFLISSGMGNDVYWFLAQAGLKDLSKEYSYTEEGQLGITEQEKGTYVATVKDMYGNSTTDLASKDEMTEEYMRAALKREYPDGTKMSEKAYNEQQMRYINTFLYIKGLAQNYRDALSGAQIDTGKYGITANEILSFIQKHDQFVSDYNLAFENPNALFDNTFLGAKYTNGVEGMFEAFSDIIFEFAPAHKRNLDYLSKKMGVYGRYSKDFTKKVGVRLKTVFLQSFFNGWLNRRFPDSKRPLQDLLFGPQSVAGRYNKIREKASIYEEGSALFDMIATVIKQPDTPSFFQIKTQIRENPYMRNNVQLAWSELLESQDDDIRQWAQDLMVYMFYITGGTDSNASSSIKTTLFDLVPPQHLADLKIGGLTYNQYVAQMMEVMANGINQDAMLEMAMVLSAKFDDIKAFPTIRSGKKSKYRIRFAGAGNQFAVISFGANKLLDNKTGLYKPYIKVVDNTTQQINVYKLCNLTFTKDKKGRIFANPIYARVPNLGYRNSTRSVYSVRADGQFDQETGKFKSLLHREGYVLYDSIQHLLSKMTTLMKNEDATSLGIKQSKDKQKMVFENVPIAFNIDTQFDKLSDENNELPGGLANNGFNSPYTTYAAIDASDHVLYVYSETDDAPLAVEFASYREKPFTVVNPDDTSKLNIRGTVTIVGNASPSQVRQIIERLPKNTKFVASSENQRLLNMRMNNIYIPNVSSANAALSELIDDGDVSGYTYDIVGMRQPSEPKTTTESSDIVEQYQNNDGKERPSDKC